MRTDDGDQPPTYRILDSHGRLIGCVRVPSGGPPLGRGAGTVLLVRERQTSPPGACLRGTPIGCRR
jgi:hypothetical protein